MSFENVRPIEVSASRSFRAEIKSPTEFDLASQMGDSRASIPTTLPALQWVYRIEPNLRSENYVNNRSSRPSPIRWEAVAILTNESNFNPYFTADQHNRPEVLARVHLPLSSEELLRSGGCGRPAWRDRAV